MKYPIQIVGALHFIISVGLWFDLKCSFLSLEQGKLQKVKTLVTMHVETTLCNAKELD